MLQTQACHFDGLCAFGGKDIETQEAWLLCENLQIFGEAFACWTSSNFEYSFWAHRPAFLLVRSHYMTHGGIWRRSTIIKLPKDLWFSALGLSISVKSGNLQIEDKAIVHVWKWWWPTTPSPPESKNRKHIIDKEEARTNRQYWRELKDR